MMRKTLAIVAAAAWAVTGSTIIVSSAHGAANGTDNNDQHGQPIILAQASGGGSGGSSGGGSSGGGSSGSGSSGSSGSGSSGISGSGGSGNTSGAGTSS